VELTAAACRFKRSAASWAAGPTASWLLQRWSGQLRGWNSPKGKKKCCTLIHECTYFFAIFLAFLAKFGPASEAKLLTNVPSNDAVACGERIERCVNYIILRYQLIFLNDQHTAQELTTRISLASDMLDARKCCAQRQEIDGI
jgi:hypothetical protein